MIALPIPPIDAVGSAIPAGLVPVQPQPARTSFADMLTDGVDMVMTKVEDADRISQAFILDDSIPVHQVTFALEQARLSMELMMQVRGRLLEGYQQLMNMQL
jgi:flagellar hook-basal body complex protein FliE